MSQEKPFAVNLWLDNPLEETADNCWTGDEFATLEEARECLCNLARHFDPKHFSDIPYIELIGPGVHEVIVNALAIKKRKAMHDSYQSMVRNERAMEAGMGLGIHAYNEMMGYDSEEPEYIDEDGPYHEYDG